MVDSRRGCIGGRVGHRRLRDSIGHGQCGESGGSVGRGLWKACGGCGSRLLVGGRDKVWLKLEMEMTGWMGFQKEMGAGPEG